ncbi:MAG: hypothetical protein NTV52_15075 [Acidobacteria bacterium]|nr:hypothetical protein [Acidobacteriota bacterium]
MSQQLTDEEKKARRAEINRQNAQKSTGPRTQTGKMNSRINSLKNGSRTVIVDHTGAPGLALLSGEDIAEYRNMVAEYSRYLSPRNRVETGIVQRIVDAQWRQLRNSRLQTLELESCLADVRETEYPGVAPQLVGAIDLMMANRMALDAKIPQQLQREEAALVRLINASLRELNMLRKLNPMPKSPVRPNTEYLGPDAGPVDHLFREEPTEVQETKEEEAPPTSERSQRETGWSPVLERPAKPLVRAAGSTVETNVFSDQPEPPY